MLRWGLIPSWARDMKTGYRMINARAESITTKPAFRNAFRYRRCLIPATGFYEWQKKDGRKQPWFICLKDQDLFAFAGLWEHWQGPEGQLIESCTIITTKSNDLVAQILVRMPVILHQADYDLWLAPSSQVRDLLPRLRPFPASEMTAWPVSPLVNNPSNNSPACIEPVGH